MKKFSKILESSGTKSYKVSAQLDMIIEAENDGEAGYVADSTISKLEGVDKYHITNLEELSNIEESLVIESKSKIKSELEDNNDYQMVSGIIDILKKVKDKENRMEIANDMISQFKREDIKFDYDKFLDSIK
jgi:hypothetical protein